jgi:ABC-type branched-subunit amino acid transport system substrate-binding protein
MCAALAVLLCLPGRGRSETGVTAKEIVVGSCADLEGPTKIRGLEQKQAVEAYFSSVNEQGGVHGRKLRLVSHDDSYDPAKAVQCFGELEKDGAFVDGFFIGSATGVKYAVMANLRKIPILGINSGAEFLYDPVKRYVFNVRSSYYDQTAQSVEHLWNDLGLRKIGVIYQNDAYGAAIFEGVKRALETRGAAPVVISSFKRLSGAGQTADLGDAVKSLKQSPGIQAVILGGVGEPDAQVVQASRAAGIKALFVAVTNDPTFYFKRGGAVDGAVMISPFPDAGQKNLHGVAMYAQTLRKSFPQARETSVGLEAFVDAQVIVEALRREGDDPTREGFVDALESMHDLDLGLGPEAQDKIGFSAQSHKGLQKSYATVIHDGAPVVLSDWKRQLAN